MDGFFEKYGRMIIVAVAICFVLLLFTPMKNKIGDNINGFVGNFANQTNKSLNEVRMPDELGTGDILNIEGKKYIVMSKKDKDTYLLISGENIGNMQYQPNKDSDGNYKVGTYETPDEKRPDGQYSNTYEGSYIDNYLENTWYKQLPEKLQKAIQTTDIKQASYRYFASNPKWRWFDPNGGSNNNWYYNEGTTENPKWVIYTKGNVPDDAQGAYPLNCWKYSEKGYNNTAYNTISRHVYLPSVEDLQMASTDITNTRDAFHNGNDKYIQYLGTQYDGMFTWTNNTDKRPIPLTPTAFMQAAFIVDLSKVDYELVK